MSPEIIEKARCQIHERKQRYQDSAADYIERNMLVDFLRSIEHGTCDRPQECARLLQTMILR